MTRHISNLRDLPEDKLRHLCAHQCLIGRGRHADVFTLGNDKVLRAMHMEYNPYNRPPRDLEIVQKRYMEYDAWCLLFSSHMKKECPTLRIPELLDHKSIEQPLIVGEKKYYAFQILSRVKGEQASYHLHANKNPKVFCQDLAYELYLFHNVADKVSRSMEIPEEDGYTQSRIGAITSRFHLTAPSQENLELMQLLQSDLASKYDSYDRSRYAVLHGDIHPENILTVNKGRIGGLLDASPRRAPVETEFFPLARNMAVATKVAKIYGELRKNSIDMGLVYLAAASTQLYFAYTDGPERYKAVTECLDALTGNHTPNKAYYEAHSKRLKKQPLKKCTR